MTDGPILFLRPYPKVADGTVLPEMESLELPWSQAVGFESRLRLMRRSKKTFLWIIALLAGCAVLAALATIYQ